MFDIKKFLEDKNESEAFITGPGGSGKTEHLIGIVKELNKLKIPYQVVAFTNKAVEVIQERVPNAPSSTLHSWLKKRPGINSEAKHLRTLITSKQFGKPEPLRLLIVDEFSMIDESDYFSIGELIDPNMTGDILLKTLYIGDLSQLSPIKGSCPIVPQGDYWTQLTNNYRTKNQLQDTLAILRDMINNEEFDTYLNQNNDFLRDRRIIQEYKENDSESKILLAYTNEMVQKINKLIQGYDIPKSGDIMFNNSTKEMVKLVRELDPDEVYMLHTPMKDVVLTEETKYNPLNTLKSLPYVRYYELEDGRTIAGIFGSYENKSIRSKLGTSLTEKNKAGKNSKKEYKIFKCVNDYVCVLDFGHCVTTHKTQGSEWDYVYIASKDYEKCLNRLERLKLFYVGISRARLKCYLDN